MAFAPQPFVVEAQGDAQDAPAAAKPISLYGVEVASAEVTIADVTGLEARLSAIESRLDALETPEA